MIKPKPALLPVGVPWQISPSVSYLRIHKDSAGRPESATFIGYFRCDDFPDHFHDGTAVEVVYETHEFHPTPLSTRVPFRMVRIMFDDGRKFRILPAVSDGEIIRESAYDWSAVSGALLPDETSEQNVARARATWLSSGLCPDPGMYEVQHSPWLAELGANGAGLRHYILLGDDEYAEVIAQDCGWEPGQPVD